MNSVLQHTSPGAQGGPPQPHSSNEHPPLHDVPAQHVAMIVSLVLGVAQKSTIGEPLAPPVALVVVPAAAPEEEPAPPAEELPE